MAENKSTEVTEAEILLFPGETEDALKVCFVCTGNTCRSPMAEVLLAHMARKKPVCVQGEDGKVRTYRKVLTASAGLSPLSGDRISSLAVEALLAAEIRETEDKPFIGRAVQLLTEAHLRQSDLLVAMTPEHLFAMMVRYPAYVGKMRCMPAPVPDPYGAGPEVYAQCLEAIRANLEVLFFAGDARHDDPTDHEG